MQNVRCVLFSSHNAEIIGGRETDGLIYIYRCFFSKHRHKTSHLVTAPRSRLLSGLSYPVRDTLTQPPGRPIVRLLPIFQMKAIKPVGSGMRMIHCIQMGPFVFPELLSVVRLFQDSRSFNASSINRQLIKIIAVSMFRTNRCVYWSDQ